MIADTTKTLTIHTIKEVYDFANNLYYIVEFCNTGYLLYHATTGIKIEYSITSTSPYKNHTKNLYYCGPTEYYVLDSNTFIHTISGDSFAQRNVDCIRELSAYSNELHNSCVSLSPPLSIRKATSDLSSFTGKSISINANKKATQYFVPGKEKIRKLLTKNQIGYTADGVCGYIAAGMLLYWFDECKGLDEVINDFTYLNKSRTGFRGPELTKYLRLFGHSNDSDANAYLSKTSMLSVLQGYGIVRYFDFSYETNLLTNSDYIIDVLSEKNVPVIVFSKIYRPGVESDKVNHAVLAYGYNSSGEIIAHLGWENYSEVVLSCFLGIVGSTLCIYDPCVWSLPVKDVQSSHWSYRATQYCLRYQIINCVSNGNFRGNDIINRGSFINAMYKLVGRPPVSGAASIEARFSDFSSSSANHDAIVWAYQQGILSGTSANTIGAQDNLTREQAVTFLKRFSDYLGCTFSSTSGPKATTFQDYNDISKYARTAVNWATIRYLMQGSDGMLNPNKYMTRAEAAQIIYSFATRAKY